MSAPYAEIENENINTIVYFSADCFQQVLRCGIPAISRDIGKKYCIAVSDNSFLKFCAGEMRCRDVVCNSRISSDTVRPDDPRVVLRSGVLCLGVC